MDCNSNLHGFDTPDALPQHRDRKQDSLRTESIIREFPSLRVHLIATRSILTRVISFSSDLSSSPPLTCTYTTPLFSPPTLFQPPILARLPRDI